MSKKNIDYSTELILVVDDEEGIAENLVDLLKNRGFNASYVVSGRDALRELKEKKSCTFLVTDIVMPDMDGLELMRTAKNEYPDLCIIAMTGFDNQYTYVDVLNSGATDFINKPFGIEELEAKIRRSIIERDTKQELRKLSITDSLTELYNQRHFYTRLEDEIIRAKRQRQHLALLLLDLDNFKCYNDEHGHLAGDEVLQQCGSIIKAQIRQGVDSGYRYGGDEFAVILIGAGSEICLNIGERIAKVFEKECGMAISMGHAVLSDDMTLESFIDEADKHLYKFKGKNALNTQYEK